MKTSLLGLLRSTYSKVGFSTVTSAIPTSWEIASISDLTESGTRPIPISYIGKNRYPRYEYDIPTSVSEINNTFLDYLDHSEFL